MTTTSVLFCLAALLTIYSHAAGSINCRKFVYHPKCRGVAAKRSDLPALVSHRRPHVDRKLDDELPEPEYNPESIDVTNEVLQAMPRRNPALWNYLGDRPANLLLARRTLDQEPLPLELTYDYE
ncbi:uncharacterized protein LOC124363864 isoform X1 [Homalodisca vitripennis]|uniref:uncharacterized protein LOC124363864 isoform X1 n=1 Tax=Homalodisca vitripennis TaxID=197043 RepID=UPI001EEB85EA|nr:uncharacterized protein LOC124363864 isoform X1 [Homalodisca vitripennis]